ncbi:hypothetical protein WJX74_004927 [Apatococcus lobatus]|uniref:Uncharacterized protein n=1 Tax=Apatococcus lobatus TaxID=904363 RepID=A0AAW1R270_9CHLO
MSRREGRLTSCDQAASVRTATFPEPGCDILPQSLAQSDTWSHDFDSFSVDAPQQVDQGHAAPAQPVAAQTPPALTPGTPAQPPPLSWMSCASAALAWASLLLFATACVVVAFVVMGSATTIRSPTLTTTLTAAAHSSNWTCPLVQPAAEGGRASNPPPVPKASADHSQAIFNQTELRFRAASPTASAQHQQESPSNITRPLSLAEALTPDPHHLPLCSLLDETELSSRAANPTTAARLEQESLRDSTRPLTLIEALTTSPHHLPLCSLLDEAELGSRAASPNAHAPRRVRPLLLLLELLLVTLAYPPTWLIGQVVDLYLHPVGRWLCLGLFMGVLVVASRKTQALAKHWMETPASAKCLTEARRQLDLAQQRVQLLEGHAAWLAALADPFRLWQTRMLSAALLRLVERFSLSRAALAYSCDSPRLLLNLAFPALRLQTSAVCTSLIFSPLVGLLITAAMVCFCWRLPANLRVLGCCCTFFFTGLW